MMAIGRGRAGTVEQVNDCGRPLACIIYADHRPDATQFVTPEDRNQQVGFIVYRAGERIARHTHLPIERRIVGTGEVLVVREGRRLPGSRDRRRGHSRSH